MANLRSRPPRLDPDAFIAGAEQPPRPAAAPAPAEPPQTSAKDPRPARRPAARAEAAGKAGQGRAAAPERPWEASGVRGDVTKVFNLRLPEPLKLKLDYIRENTRISAHEFVMSALVPAVEAEIRRLEKERGGES